MDFLWDKEYDKFSKSEISKSYTVVEIPKPKETVKAKAKPKAKEETASEKAED